jgi:hypothetical protein
MTQFETVIAHEIDDQSGFTNEEGNSYFIDQ